MVSTILKELPALCYGEEVKETIPEEGKLIGKDFGHISGGLGTEESGKMKRGEGFILISKYILQNEIKNPWSKEMTWKEPWRKVKV